MRLATRGIAVSLIVLVHSAAMVAGVPRQALGVGRDPLLAPALPRPSPGSVDASVTQSTGAATLRIPIEAPPGPGGFQPNLALVYSSHKAGGPFGVGWELPLDEIRCAIRFGVPDHTQGCADFELNGQALVRVGSTDRYHTFVESFQRVEYKAGTNTWEVARLDGTKLLLGTDIAHRVHVANDPNQPVARWLLAEAIDPHGNTITYTYDQGDEGSPYPDTITYGVGGVRKIEFVLADRPDPSHDFLGGIERHLRKRVREIRVLVGTKIFHRRLLNYDDTGYATGSSRLTSTQLFGTDCDPDQHPDPAGCAGLPVQHFRYTDPKDTLGTSDPQWASEPAGSPWLPPVDFATMGEPGFPWPWDRAARLGDVDGDGLVDVVQAFCDYRPSPATEPALFAPCDAATEGTRAVYLNNGSGWSYDATWSQYLENLPFEAQTLVVSVTEDDEGDTTICDAVPGTPEPRRIGFTELRQDYIPISQTVGPTVTSYTLEPWQDWDLVDLNGDGRADLISSTSIRGASRRIDCDRNVLNGGSYVPLPGIENRVVYLNNGDGWDRAPELETNLPPLTVLTILRSVWDPIGPGNKDGATSCDGAGQYGFVLCTSWMYLMQTFVELNGDGRLDLISLTPTKPDTFWINDFPVDGYQNEQNPARSDAWIQATDGSGWIPSAAFSLPFQHATHQFIVAVWQGDGGVWQLDSGVRFADLNRDGLTDVLWTDPFLARSPSVDHAFSPRDSSGTRIARGVLLNTGAGWCASYDTQGPCGDAAERYVPPVDFAHADQQPVSLPSGPLSWYPTTHHALSLADANGDGWIDLMRLDGTVASSEGLKTWLHNQATPAGGPLSVWKEDSRFAPPVAAEFGFQLADVDANGTIDIIRGLKESSGSVREARRSQSTLPDLLAESDNGRGGTTKYTYETATAQQDVALESDAEAHADDVGETPAAGNTGMTRWFQLPVVTSVTTEGPSLRRDTNPDPEVVASAPAPAVTQFAYARPRWSPDQRTGLGFRLVEATQSDGTLSQRFLYQAHGRAGRLSKEILWSQNAPVRQLTEVWGLPAPTTVGVPATSIAGVHVGRLESRTYQTEYGATPGASTGAIRREDFSYNDTYGYNFVAELTVTRPTGVLRTLRTPWPASVDPFIAGLVAILERKDGAGTVLSNAEFAYSGQGDVLTRTDLVQPRGGAGTDQTTTFGYDNPYGNLISRSETVSGIQRTTLYCYDGDDGCPSGQESHSLLAGVRDPLLNWTHLTPDEVHPRAAVIDSPYTDEPTVHREFDPFGRLERELLGPSVGAEFVSRTIEYTDGSPSRQRVRAYVGRPEPGSEGGAEAVQTTLYDDGFGRTWRVVEESTHEGPDPRYFGRSSFFDPTTRTRWETLPIACGSDETCALLADLQLPAVVTTTDPLGRVTSVAQPDGSYSVAYQAGDTPESVPPGASSVEPVDLHIVTDPNANVTRRLVDGDRVVLVQECPDQACSGPDETFFTYEATGEISTVYDAIAVDSSTWNDASHYLRRHYDTLGRVRQIDDPDGGTSFTGYDEAGNVLSTTNARGQIATFEYDVLDRLKKIDQQSPGPQRDYELIYLPNQRQLDVDRINAQNGMLWHRLTYQYDDMGRVQRTTYKFPDKTMLLDFAYDELGRLTTVTYPDTETVVRYEYADAYLEQVCEVTSPSTPCEDEDAISYVDSVEYDELGRRKGVHTPAGDRSYAYDPSSHRLALDGFTSRSSGAYTRDLAYSAYDSLGNILQVDGVSQTGAVNFSSTYTYDHRNRLETWQKPAAGSLPAMPTAYFKYDELGNLTGHAVGSSAEQNQEFGQDAGPHAVTARTDLDLLFTYDDDGNLAAETETSSGVARYFTFDVFNRLSCVGPSAGSCLTLFVDYDSGGARIHENYLDSSGGWVARRYAGEYFTLDGTRGDFHIFAFGEEIAYKRMFPVTLRTASAWVAPGIELRPPLALAILAGLGLVGLGFVGVRRDWAPGLREDPVLAAFSLALVIVLVVPPLPARAGGGGGSVLYRRWILEDHLGSATIVLEANPVDPSETQEGRAEREVVYAPFGAIHEEAGSQGTDTAVFAGHPLEPTSGLHYMQARWQNPTTGTFLSVDPLVAGVFDPQSYNGYSYTQNNPVSFIDPTGRGESWWFPGFLGGIIGLVTHHWDFHGFRIDRLKASAQPATSDLGTIRDPSVAEQWEPPAGSESQSGRQYADAGNVATDAGTDPYGTLETPPGVDINKNIEEARGKDILWFRDQVRNGGPWDYKQQGREYQNFGNKNYGATGRALGLSERFLLREAGRAQQAAGTSRPEWGDPGSRFNPFGGTGSYGDDPVDQYWIRQGFGYYDAYSGR